MDLTAGHVWVMVSAARVMASPSRHNEVNVMPAHGLTLEEVGYPPDDELASRADAARAVRTLDPDRFQHGANGGQHQK